MARRTKKSRRPERGHHHHHGRNHPRRLYLVIVAVAEKPLRSCDENPTEGKHNMPPIPIAAPTNAVSSIAANDPRTFALLILEAGDDGVVIAAPSKGPFTVNVADPSGLLAETAGSADNTTPTTFKLAGTTASGTVLITVTDTSVTPPPGGHRGANGDARNTTAAAAGRNAACSVPHSAVDCGRKSGQRETPGESPALFFWVRKFYLVRTAS